MAVVVNAVSPNTIKWGPSSALTTVTVPAGATLGFLYYGGVWSVASQSYATASGLAFGTDITASAIGNTTNDGSGGTVAHSNHQHGRTAPISFRAHRTAAVVSQVPPIHTFGFDTLDFDTAGGYSYSSGVSYYTIPTTGKYLVSARLSISMAVVSALPLNQRFFISLYNGSTEISRGNDYTTGGLMGAVLNDLVPCTAGDVLSIWQYTTSVGAFEVGTHVAYWSIVQVA